jgi:hypothetical protein
LRARADQQLQKDGLSVAVASLADRVAFCITAADDLKISSEYGIEFKTDRRNSVFWLEALPKVVTGPPYYFDLPLRIELRTRGNVRERRIELNLGVCSSAASTCVPISLEVIVSAVREEKRERSREGTSDDKLRETRRPCGSR